MAEVEGWHREAQRCLNAADLQGARAACLQLLAREPGHADAHFLLGMVAMAEKRFGDALVAIDRAVGRHPAAAEYHAQRARCLAVLKRDSEARSAAERAVALGPRDALTLDTIGVVWSRLNEHGLAVSAFERAVAAAHDKPEFHYNLAASLRILGRFDEAERAYEAVVRLAPRFYRAHSALAELRKQTTERNHVASLTQLLATVGADVDGELHLRHALAKELEDLGRYDDAFTHLAAGKARKRQTLSYSIAADEELFDAVERAFDQARFASAAQGADSAEPIFVVGLPRSGTTLVERILSSHSGVYSAGELQNFGWVLKKAAGTPSNRVLDAETVRRGVECDLGEVGRRYVASTRPGTALKPHFVDKMPLNFFYIGFIALALPRAKIVCLRRHPLDSCLSLYRQLFAVTFSYYNFTYDLRDVGRYYALFDRLMRHWRDVLPGRVLEMQYESLVADQESETRRLLEHCDLPWESAALRFESNTAPIATASSVQVRSPIYATSVGRWRRYEAQLAPAMAQLRAAGIAWD